GQAAARAGRRGGDGGRPRRGAGRHRGGRGGLHRRGRARGPGPRPGPPGGAVRRAAPEARLRGTFSAMFISLSRRSVPLIDRLSRMIDSMEQNEDDPDQLSNLFSMDHLVTRMRRNSENLLVLAGEEPVRKWTESVPLSDVTRAAAAEIEQYSP